LEIATPFLSAKTQPVPFHWQQVDQRLSGILQSKVSAELGHLMTDDVGHIRFQNMHNVNSMTIPSQRLLMQRLRTKEWAARLYEGYCEIWQTQRMPISADSLRGIVKNAISVLCSARVNAVTYDFVQEQHRTGSDAKWLKPALEAFKRDLQLLEHNWTQTAEFDAMTVQYMLSEAPESAATKVAAREVITARARIHTLEAMIASIDARIAMAEQALNGMLIANTPPYRKSSVEQSLSRLKTNGRSCDQALTSGSTECKPRLSMLKMPKPKKPPARRLVRHRRIQARPPKKERRSGHDEGHRAPSRSEPHEIGDAKTQSASRPIDRNGNGRQRLC
jgi:hypothetical protein